MAIYVDGGCNKQTGDEAWGSVVDDTGRDLITSGGILFDLNIKEKLLPQGKRNIIVAKFNDVKSQQNNGAEICAMVAGLRIALRNPDIKIIYSDSSLVINYWSQGKVNPKTWNKMDKAKRQYILECSSLRSAFEQKGGKILKISGKDNLADLGYHK